MNDMSLLKQTPDRTNYGSVSLYYLYYLIDSKKTSAIFSCPEQLLQIIDSK